MNCSPAPQMGMTKKPFVHPLRDFLPPASPCLHRGSRTGTNPGCHKFATLMKNRRKFIPICALQIAKSNSNIIENYEKVTPILIFS